MYLRLKSPLVNWVRIEVARWLQETLSIQEVKRSSIRKTELFIEASHEAEAIKLMEDQFVELFEWLKAPPSPSPSLSDLPDISFHSLYPSDSRDYCTPANVPVVLDLACGSGEITIALYRYFFSFNQMIPSSSIANSRLFTV